MIARLSHWLPLRTAAAPVAVLLGLLPLAGCGDGYPTDMAYGVRTDPMVNPQKRPEGAPPGFGAPGEWPYLRPGFTQARGQLLDPTKLSTEVRNQFDTTLINLFGTPAAPKVAPDKPTSEEAEALKMLRLDADTLAAGSKLYRRHCLHCHGLTGNGQGPTGPWVNPHPRDYRLGVFKFTSSSQTSQRRKPRREDLLRVLKQGIEGTSMPTFGLLPEDELQKLSSYVTHLSIRGQCEAEVMTGILLSGETAGAKQVDRNLRDLLPEILGFWRDAESSLIDPKSSPPVVPGTARTDAEREALKESIRRGHTLFMSAAEGGGCIACHTNFGRTPNLKWDEWGTVVRPADLTTGIYRGGRRPIDIFWRIHSGVNGTGMPAFPDVSKEKEMWDLVNFVLALPYPRMLPDDIERQIYPAEAPRSVAALRE